MPRSRGSPSWPKRLRHRRFQAKGTAASQSSFLSCGVVMRSSFEPRPHRPELDRASCTQRRTVHNCGKPGAGPVAPPRRPGVVRRVHICAPLGPITVLRLDFLTQDRITRPSAAAFVPEGDVTRVKDGAACRHRRRLSVRHTQNRRGYPRPWFYPARYPADLQQARIPAPDLDENAMKGDICRPIAPVMPDGTTEYLFATALNGETPGPEGRGSSSSSCRSNPCASALLPLAEGNRHERRIPR